MRSVKPDSLLSAVSPACSACSRSAEETAVVAAGTPARASRVRLSATVRRQSTA
jgi:hypothetical protein